MTSDETRPDRDAVRERVTAAIYPYVPYRTDAEDAAADVLAVVEPALAQRDAEIERLRADLVAIAFKDPDVRTLYTFEAGIEVGRIEARAEIERLHDDVNEWKSWEAKARGDLRDMEIERNALRISLREVLAKAETDRRVIAAVEALCDEADGHKRREPYYAWVRSSDLRAALAGDQP